MPQMKSIASVLSIIALGFGLLGCPGGGGGGGGGSSTPGFAVSTTAADFGVVGNAYTSTLATTGGTAPFTWTLSGGALPTGSPNLSLDPGTGVVSGTPGAPAGNFNATFTVTDSTGRTATGSVLFAGDDDDTIVATPTRSTPHALLDALRQLAVERGRIREHYGSIQVVLAHPAW